MMWQGQLLHLHVAPTASAAMRELAEARLIAGVGIEGDRYATGRGTYSTRPHIDRQVTLIEVEVLDAIFSQLPLGTSFQALPWKSIFDVPAQVVPGPAAQSFWPFIATPKHFSLPASSAA